MQRIIADSNAKIRQAAKLLRNESALGYDSETSGLDSHTGKIWSLQLSSDAVQALIPINGKPEKFDLSPINDLLSNPSVTIVAHNMAFDLKVAWSLGLDIARPWCTRVGEALLSAGLFGNNSLSGVVKRYFGIDLSKDERDEFYKDVDGGIALETGKLTVFESNGMKWTPELINYALLDTTYLVPLMMKQRERLAGEGMLRLAEVLEMPLVKVTAAMEYRGVKMDREACLKFQGEMKAMAEKTKVELVKELNEKWQQHARPIYTENKKVWDAWQARQREIVTSTNKMRDPENKKRINDEAKQLRASHLEIKPFNSPPKEPGVINLRSNPQMRAALAKYGVYLKDLRKETLQDAAQDHPIIEDLVEYKKYDKLSQMSEIYEKINPATGRIHGVFNQIVDTGRYSSSQPNLQNIPARSDEGSRFRSLFICEEGNTLVAADYSAIELVIIGVRSKDKVLLHALNNDLDLHCWTMSKFLNCPYEHLVAIKDGKGKVDNVGVILEARKRFETNFNLSELQKCGWDGAGLQKWVKTFRDYVKTLTYGIAYGLSAFGLARRFHCDAEEAQRFIDVFFGVYRDIKRWLDSQAESGLRDGYSKTTSGRRRYYRRPTKPTRQDIIDEVNKVLKQQDREALSLSREEVDELWDSASKKLWKEYKQTVNRIRRQAANHPVQGGSADMTKRAMVYFESWWVPYAKKHGVDWRKYGIVLTVHDEIVIELPERFAKEAVNKLKYAMETSARDFLGHSVKVVVTPKTAKHWSEAK